MLFLNSLSAQFAIGTIEDSVVSGVISGWDRAVFRFGVFSIRPTQLAFALAE
jgi:hypothetical protein